MVATVGGVSEWRWCEVQGDWGDGGILWTVCRLWAEFEDEWELEDERLLRLVCESVVSKCLTVIC